MKWRCSKCGFEQPRSPKTQPEEMPRCSQYIGNRSDSSLGPVREDLDRVEWKWDKGPYTCGGAPLPID